MALQSRTVLSYQIDKVLAAQTFLLALHICLILTWRDQFQTWENRAFCVVSSAFGISSFSAGNDYQKFSWDSGISLLSGRVTGLLSGFGYLFFWMNSFPVRSVKAMGIPSVQYMVVLGFLSPCLAFCAGKYKLKCALSGNVFSHMQYNASDKNRCINCVLTRNTGVH